MGPSKFDYKFTTLKKRLFPEFSSVNCNLTLGAVKSYGRGDDRTVFGAKTKAFAESLERLALKKSLPIYQFLNRPRNSNGIAFHFEEKVAEDNAICELIERELVLRSWAFEQKVFSIDIAYFSNSTKFISSTLKNFIQKYGAKINLLLFGEVRGVFVCGCQIEMSNNKPHTVIGYAAKKTLNEAVAKSLIEACVMFERYQYLPQDPQKSITNRFLINLNEYAENPYPIDYIFPNITKVDSIQLERHSLLFEDIESKVFDMKSIGISGYIARASSSKFIPFRAGKLAQEIGIRSCGEVMPIA